ncbi:MAG: hypothetical protein LBR85_09865, partial [Oscillospiraceae bacterium]|nr:hypothetical protein [Oscillospiraceae bacterium]
LFLKEERNAMPQFSISEIDAMLKGSYTESLIGILPHSEASAEEYRTERLKIKEPFDYTEWQRQLYDGVPLKSFPRDAMELRTKETP